MEAAEQTSQSLQAERARLGDELSAAARKAKELEKALAAQQAEAHDGDPRAPRPAARRPPPLREPAPLHSGGSGRAEPACLTAAVQLPPPRHPPTPHPPSPPRPRCTAGEALAQQKAEAARLKRRLEAADRKAAEDQRRLQAQPPPRPPASPHAACLLASHRILAYRPRRRS